MLRGKLAECYSKSEGDRELYFVPTEETKKLYETALSLQSCVLDASRSLSMGRRMGERLAFSVPSMALAGPVLDGMSDMLDNIEDTIEEDWDDWIAENLTNPRYFTPDGEDTLSTEDDTAA